MITIELTGDRELIAKLNTMPQKVHDNLLRKISMFAINMEAIVKRKLSGEVLKKRTGNLRDAVFHEVTDTATSFMGKVAVSPNIPYAAIHEYGGTTAAHVITPKAGNVLAFVVNGKTIFARQVNHPGSRIPARPYMRPTLAEMRPAIIAGMNEAVSEGLK